MTRRAITVRVDPATVDALDAYACEHGLPGRGRALDAIMAPAPCEENALTAWLDHVGEWGRKTVPVGWVRGQHIAHVRAWVACGWVETDPDGRLVRRTVDGRQCRCVVPTDSAPT